MTKTDLSGKEPGSENMIIRFLARWPKLCDLYVKHEEIIIYLIVGVMTTIVSWSCKFLANLVLYHGAATHTSFETGVLTAINWTSGVIFAFFTNRAWVFKSRAPMLPEAGKFVLSRISTLVLEYVCMLIMDTFMGVNFYAATVITAVIVVIANYIFSKLFVFRKKKEAKGDDPNE